MVMFRLDGEKLVVLYCRILLMVSESKWKIWEVRDGWDVCNIIYNRFGGKVVLGSRWLWVLLKFYMYKINI